MRAVAFQHYIHNELKVDVPVAPAASASQEFFELRPVVELVLRQSAPWSTQSVGSLCKRHKTLSGCYFGTVSLCNM